ncbi:transposase [Oceanobacillus sp. Castelsardo]|uniref:transposase n=1 Tax=Oceanobacillus sp. Castelsardo TaxID=1851204 RepID=UPI000A4206FF|nr:transposase [Oceanobacillus sp. Castelsardo]
MLTPSIILEDKPAYTDHDRLFKELIQTFFPQFIEAFFPELFQEIDFTAVKFLEQEVFTDILKGEKRRIDILAEVKLQKEEQFILIHIEPQASYQKEFHERMFISSSRLYEKYRKPILPIAVFSYDDKREITDIFTSNVFHFQVFQFNYLQIHLIKTNWRKFIKMDNPIAAALLSKMGYTEDERVQVKLEFLKMISRMELNPARTNLLYGFFNTYLYLSNEEEKRMSEEIAKLPREEANRVLRLPNSYYEKGKKKGIEEGIEKGIEKGIEIVIYNMLQKGLPEELIAEVSNVRMEEIVKMKEKMEL